MVFSTKKFNTEIAMLKGARTGSELSPERKAMVRQRVMDSILDVSRVPRTSSLSVVQKRWFQVLVSVLGSLGLLGGTAYASTATIPGDLLYPVKRATEKVQIALAVSQQAKAEVQATQAEHRLDELHKLQEQVKAKPETAHIEEVAEKEASVNVHQALENLHKVRARLESQDKMSETEQVDMRLSRLRIRARAAHVLDVSTNSKDGRESDDGLQAEDHGQQPGKVKGTRDTHGKSGDGQSGRHSEQRGRTQDFEKSRDN